METISHLTMAQYSRAKNVRYARVQYALARGRLAYVDCYGTPMIPVGATIAPAPPRPPNAPRPDTILRDSRIYAAYLAGASVAAISEQEGLSRQWVSIIIRAKKGNQ